MSNNQNNPQEVPQVKSVEENASDYCKLKQKQGLGSFTEDDIYFMKFAHMAGQQISSDRIAELEKQNAVCREALGALLPLAKDGLIELNKVFNSQYNWKEKNAILSAEQALNSKEVGDD